MVRAAHDAMTNPEDTGPELPTDKAFVLQLSRETGPALSPFAGRIEHFATGRRLRFEDFAGFRAALNRLLTETERART